MFFLAFWFLSAYALWGGVAVLITRTPGGRADVWCNLLVVCLLGLLAVTDPWSRPSPGRAAWQAALLVFLTALALVPIGTLPAGLAWPLGYSVITGGYLGFLSLSGVSGDVPPRLLRYNSSRARHHDR